MYMQEYKRWMEAELEDFDLTVKVQPADEFKDLREFNEMLKNAGK